MITISFLGLDPYTSQHISKDIYTKLAAIFHCDPEQILVYAPESMLFHNGVDQTLWQALIHVHAPTSYRTFQAQVADFLLKTVKTHIIHGAIEFYYYDAADRIESHDQEYPRFVTESNLVNVEEHEELDEEREVYQGDVFSKVNLDSINKMSEKSKKK
jgi:hypothetical protein